VFAHKGWAVALIATVLLVAALIVISTQESETIVFPASENQVFEQVQEDLAETPVNTAAQSTASAAAPAEVVDDALGEYARTEKSSGENRPTLFFVDESGAAVLTRIALFEVSQPLQEFFRNNENDIYVEEAFENAQVLDENDLTEVDLSEFPYGEYFITASAPGFSPIGEYVTLPFDNGSSKRMVFEPGTRFEVRAQDLSGQPVSGVKIFITNYAVSGKFLDMGWRDRLAESWFSEYIETNESGVAFSSSTPEGLFRVKTADGQKGFAPVSFAPVAVKESPILFTIMPGLTIEGEVVVQGASDYDYASAEIGLMRVEQGSVTEILRQDVNADGTYRIVAGVDGGSVALIALGAGATTQVKRLEDIDVSRTYNINFEVFEATKFDVQLITSKGEPIEGIVCQFLQNERDWIPYSYEPDAGGRFQTQKMFKAETDYVLAPMSNYLPLGGFAVRTPHESSEEWVIEIPDICRPTKVSVQFEGVPEEMVFFGFQPDFYESGFMYQWGGSEAAPWLPAQPGLLLFQTKDGRMFEQPFNPSVHHGQEAVVNLDVGQLSFLLPDPPGGEDWALSLLTRAGYPAAEPRALGAGRHDLKLPLGTYNLMLTGAKEAELFYGPFVLTEAGLNIGTLEPCDWHSLAGQVVDANGAPVANVSLHALRSDGIAERNALTDEKGQFVIETMAAGVYRLDILPAKNRASDSPNMSAEFRIPRLNNEPLLFRLPSREQALSVELTPPPSALTKVHVLAGAAHTLMRINTSGIGELHSSGAAGDVLSLESNTQGVQVRYAPLSKGQQKVDLTLDGLLTRNLVLSGKDELRDVDFFFNNQHIGTAYPQADLTKWALQAPDLAALEIALTFNGGKTIRMPFRDLPTAGPLQAPAAWGNAIRVQSLSGRALSNALVCSEDGSYRLCCNAEGEADGTSIQLNQQLMVTAPGYWGRLAMPASTIQLHRDAKGADIRIAGGMGATDLAVQPEMDFGYGWQPSLDKIEDENIWQLRDCPEGKYTLYALDADGALLAEKAIELTSAELVEIRVP